MISRTREFYILTSMMTILLKLGMGMGFGDIRSDIRHLTRYLVVMEALREIEDE